VGEVGFPEVEAHEGIEQEPPQLDDVGLVQPHLSAEVVDLLRRGVLAEYDLRRIPGDEVQYREDEYRNPEYDGNHPEQSVNDIFGHIRRTPPSLVFRRSASGTAGGPSPLAAEGSYFLFQM
jgi:hypothetical protein